MIPKIAVELDNMDFPIAGESLGYISNIIQTIHSAGINIRYLGIVRKNCKNDDARKILLMEMIARVTRYFQIRYLFSFFFEKNYF